MLLLFCGIPVEPNTLSEPIPWKCLGYIVLVLFLVLLQAIQVQIQAFHHQKSELRALRPGIFHAALPGQNSVFQGSGLGFSGSGLHPYPLGVGPDIPGGPSALSSGT